MSYKIKAEAFSTKKGSEQVLPMSHYATVTPTYQSRSVNRKQANPTVDTVNRWVVCLNVHATVQLANRRFCTDVSVDDPCHIKVVVVV